MKFRMNSRELNSEIFQISLTGSRIWHSFRTVRAYWEKSLRNRRIPPAQASNRRRGAHRCPSSARRRRRAPSRSTPSTPSRPPLQQQRRDSTDQKHHPVAGATTVAIYTSKTNKQISKSEVRRGTRRGVVEGGGAVGAGEPAHGDEGAGAPVHPAGVTATLRWPPT